MPVTLDFLFLLTAGGEKLRDEHLRSCKVNPDTTTASAHGAPPNLEGYSFMKNRSTNTLALAAAFAGLLGGTTARLNAQTEPARHPQCKRLVQPRCADCAEQPNPRHDQALLQRQERLQGPGRRQRPGQEQLQGQGRLRYRRIDTPKGQLVPVFVGGL